MKRRRTCSTCITKPRLRGRGGSVAGDAGRVRLPTAEDSVTPFVNGNAAAITFYNLVGVIAILAQADTANLRDGPEGGQNIRIDVDGLSVAEGQQVMHRQALALGRESLKGKDEKGDMRQIPEVRQKASRDLYLARSFFIIFTVGLILRLFARLILIA